MKLLLNPMFVRMMMLGITAASAFVLGAVLIHHFRKDLKTEVESISQSPLTADGLPIHSYHAVIQQLKQQKHELAAQQLAERRKARTSDALSTAVFANLTCGVLFFNTSGILRQANPAARQLLGFASPTGMGLADLFRSAELRCEGSAQPASTFLDALAPALAGENVIRNIEIDFVTPDGSQRRLNMTAAPVFGEDLRPIGTTVVFTDKSDLARFCADEEARAELSREMALTLRTSLDTICGYAQQLAAERDPRVSQLATDISSEAAQLEHSIGAFLAGNLTRAAAGS